VYKIVDRAQLAVLSSGEPWLGAPIDRRDGFVHFSAHDQVMGTLRKHFAGRSDLVVLELAVDRIDPQILRWEESRDGDLFPHLYGAMDQQMVVAQHAVCTAADGDYDSLTLTP
jgi:uncharacterized protein (DUF952 family)